MASSSFFTINSTIPAVPSGSTEEAPAFWRPVTSYDLWQDGSGGLGTPIYAAGFIGVNNWFQVGSYGGEFIGSTGIDIIEFDGSYSARLDFTNMGSNSGAAYGTNFTSIERFKFGDGNDYFRAPFVTSEGFQVQGGDGNDTIIGSNGNDRFFGDAGNDVINGGAGQDTLDGGAGIDFMKGGSGRDFYYIDSATFGVWDNADDEDVVNDDWSDSVIYIAASMGVSLAYVTSSIGRIELLEAAEEGYIVTGSGNDVLVGNVFSNYLSGRAGADRLTGGGGSDIFVFDTAAHTAQRDTITDFTSGVDGLMFNSGLFDSSAQFYSVAKFAKAAALLEDQAAFIYDRSTGILHYDGDGRGAGLLAEEVVSLGKGTVLSSSDIFID